MKQALNTLIILSIILPFTVMAVSWQADATRTIKRIIKFFISTPKNI